MSIRSFEHFLQPQFANLQRAWQNTRFTLRKCGGLSDAAIRPKAGVLRPGFWEDWLLSLKDNCEAAKTESSPITVLHISDMQFGHNHRFSRLALGDPDATFDTLLAGLTLDLDQLRSDHDLIPDLLVVSGDLAEWGRKSEFDDASNFLARLSEHLGLQRRRVIVVPGNHDISRKLCESYFSECEARETEPVQPFWRKWEFFHAMLQEFYRDVPDVTFSQDQPWAWYELEDLQVIVAGLNSTMPEIHGEEEDHEGSKLPPIRRTAHTPN